MRGAERVTFGTTKALDFKAERIDEENMFQIYRSNRRW